MTNFDSEKKRGMNKIIITRIVPDGFVVNVFNVLLTRDRRYIDKYVVNHELIHTAQMRELGYVLFYVVYVIEWLWRLLEERHWYKAYKAVTFEREAYKRGRDLTYLGKRRHYAQWRKRY